MPLSQLRETAAQIERFSPIDGRKLASLQASTADEVARTVASARAVQTDWARSGFEARAATMQKACRRMLERRHEIVELAREEAGKFAPEMLFNEALGPPEYLRGWLKVARPALLPRKLTVSMLAFPGKRAEIQLVPRGVIGVIAPWNFPLANFFRPVFPALLAGNSVVIKPSEHTPACGAWFAQVMNEFLPPGVLGCVQGDGEIGRALIGSVDAVIFTGSVNAGRKVAVQCAERLIPSSIELGGKDPAIVLPDCDLGRTVAGIMHWSLTNAGQSCSAIERVYVVGAIGDRFVDTLAVAVSRLRSAPGADLAIDVQPLQNQRQLDVVSAQVKDALDRGAVLRAGGKALGTGFWYAPTLLDCCTHEMRVMKEETFGPVIAVMRVKDEEEAVRLANDSTYGLNASVWSQDLKRAEALGRRLEAGVVLVNNHSITGAWPEAAWTGVKNTGPGVSSSAYALQTVTRPVTVLVDKNKLPDPWWLPVDETLATLAGYLALVQLGSPWRLPSIPFLLRKRARAVLDFALNKGQV